MTESRNVCNRCGHANAPDSRFCNQCGHSLSEGSHSGSPPYQPPVSQSASARSIVALILGILAIFMLGFLSGVPAMIMAKQEEDDIKRGRAPQSGEMLAKLGFWLGLIGTILSGLALLFIVGVVIFGLSLPLFLECM